MESTKPFEQDHDLMQGKPSSSTVHEPIPGERDPGNLTHREVGAIGGRFNGADDRSEHSGEMDEQTTRDRVMEGGDRD